MSDEEIEERVADRYQKLVMLMGEELGFEHGWITRVAERLGLHASYITKIKNGSRRMSVNAALRACDRLGLSRGFFFEAAEPESLAGYRHTNGTPKPWSTIRRRAAALLRQLLTPEDRVSVADVMAVSSDAQIAAAALAQECARLEAASLDVVHHDHDGDLGPAAQEAFIEQAHETLTAIVKTGGGASGLLTDPD